MNLYINFFKPSLDWILAFLSLIVLSPLFIIIAIAIKLETKGPAFFTQERLGLNGKVFTILKFRSMTVDNRRRNNYKLYENDPRITKIGHIIRKTSIDELPQLINILCGDMSFIGPRPPVPYFPKKIEEYNEFEFQRFLLRPGISGLAQVRCREIHDWDINIPIDIEYVRNCSFIYDLKLFFASLLFFFRWDNTYRKD
jgi:undecaprenyl phosphate N,N'-diacetylbacillosamine 1-phosphate transferase